MGKLNTNSPIYYMENKWENWLNLRYTIDRLFLTNILEVQHFQTCLNYDDDDDDEAVYDHQALMYSTIFAHHKTVQY